MALGGGYLGFHLRYELFIPGQVRFRNPTADVQAVMDGVGCGEGLPGHALPHAVGAGRIYHHLYPVRLLRGLGRYLPAHPDVVVRPGHVAGYAVTAAIDRLVVDVQVCGREVQAVIVPWHLEAHELGVPFAAHGYLVIKVCNTLVGDRDILWLHVQRI